MPDTMVTQLTLQYVAALNTRNTLCGTRTELCFLLSCMPHAVQTCFITTMYYYHFSHCIVLRSAHDMNSNVFWRLQSNIRRRMQTNGGKVCHVSMNCYMCS